MFHIALFEPEIPPNTGNIIRLCANTGSQLHLIKPYAFELDDKRLRRAGLDYHEWANVNEHNDIATMLASLEPMQRVFACSTKGTKSYSELEFQAGDVLLFGPESRGLPESVLNHAGVTGVTRIPMQPNSRSLNLSNAAAIILYEALRQTNFEF